jgi:hypothetical protein
MVLTLAINSEAVRLIGLRMSMRVSVLVSVLAVACSQAAVVLFGIVLLPGHDNHRRLCHVIFLVSVLQVLPSFYLVLWI